MLPELKEMRLDKWLWAARFFKTRASAQKEIELGRVKINGVKAKSSKTIRVGDVLEMTYHHLPVRLTIQSLSARRGPATEARLLYREDEAMIRQREKLKLERALNSGVYHSAYKEGRPTKRDRRLLDKVARKSNG